MNTKRAPLFVPFLLLTLLLAARAEPPVPDELQPRPTDGDREDAECTLIAADLRMVVKPTDSGLRVASLMDTGAKQELLSGSHAAPLFTVTLRRASDAKQTQLSADAGWGHVEVVPLTSSEGLVLRWQSPHDQELKDVHVEARAVANTPSSAIAWTLSATSGSDQWSLWEVVFPQLAVAELSSEACVFFPRGPGEVAKGVWQREFSYSGLYPNGWTSMQFQAAYDLRRNTGLYFALHDPLGSTKDVAAVSRPDEHAVVLRFTHPASPMGRGGNDFSLSGHAVWQLLRGDWYDASVIYRDWVSKEARWYPQRAADGRTDTPPWMRELCVWALGGGPPSECVPAVKRFAEFLGLPTGFHWYNWHTIPFDNDYPHYFPTKDGFAEGVKELQAANVYVMPYINGRLWDTRDQGQDDFEFTRVALPAVTKDEKGQPYTETYGSKESDGSPVRLGVMCPATPLWRQRVTEIVGRLLNEYGLNAVYIDQVAAASPKLCFDPTHGHPLGGGHWWTEGYWQLMDQIRQAKPPESMLTTECNAEPYVRWFDGYLTWHWQHDGQVPAFPAVYGGAIQMFGRAYRGGDTQDLALRMKAGQQLVFGEQIGWINPGVIDQKENAEFLRQVVRLRWQLRRYFYAGEMARPPSLQGSIPTVRADWQWSGTWWVTTGAVLAGAWKLPQENKLALVFVNVSDQPLTSGFEFDGARYGFEAQNLCLTHITADGPGQTETVPLPFHRDLSFPARQAWAWEITP